MNTDTERVVFAEQPLDSLLDSSITEMNETELSEFVSELQRCRIPTVFTEAVKRKPGRAARSKSETQQKIEALDAELDL